MRISIVAFAAIFAISSIARSGEDVLTVKEVEESYKNKNKVAAAESLRNGYRNLVGHIFKIGGKDQDKRLKQNLAKHSAVFDRLISFAAAEAADSTVAQIAAEWVLNGKAIGSELAAHVLQGKPRPKFTSLQQVRRKLPNSSVLIEIVKYRYYNLNTQTKGKPKEKYAAWVIPNDESAKVFVVDLPNSDSIKSLVDTFKVQREAAQGWAKKNIAILHNPQFNFKTDNDGRLPKWNEALQKIREATLDKIDKAAGGSVYKAEHWVLGPAADLWLVPFAAIPLPKSPNKGDANNVTYAVEKHTITYVTTGRDILTYGQPPSSNWANSLVVGPPDFGDKKVASNTRSMSPSTLTSRSRSDSILHNKRDINWIIAQKAGKKIYTIEMTNFKFKPKDAKIDITKFDTIRFVCKQGSHRVTCKVKGKDGKPLFDSGPKRIRKGKHFNVDVKKLVKDAGGKPVKLPYICPPHEDMGMTGSLELTRGGGDKLGFLVPIQMGAATTFARVVEGQIHSASDSGLSFCSFGPCIYADARIAVRCGPNTIVSINGVRFCSTGPQRNYYVLSLRVDRQYEFQLKGLLKKDGKNVTVVKNIKVRGGEVQQVDLRSSDNSDNSGGFLLSKLPDQPFGKVPGFDTIAVNLAKKLGAKRMPGKEATEKAVFAQFNKSKTPENLIFCTHGFYLSKKGKKPLATCGLALADANTMLGEEIPLKHKIDGILSGIDATELNLKKVDLVVTIACQTMQGDVPSRQEVNGGSIASMRHAFRMAGARTIVATLWEIHVLSGEVTIVGKADTKVKSFFDNLVKEKMQDKGKALREAQIQTIQWLRKTENNIAHPYFWASFSLTGDWGVLQKALAKDNEKK